MIIPPRYIVVVLLCAICFGLGWYVRSPAPPSHQPITHAMVAAAKADTIVVEKVVYNTKWKVRYDSIRDTLNITDTVQVKEYVRVADSSIFACNQALGSCLTALKLKDTVMQEQAHFIERMQKPRPKAQILLWLSIGAIGGYVAHSLQQ